MEWTINEKQVYHWLKDNAYTLTSEWSQKHVSMLYTLEASVGRKPIKVKAKTLNTAVQEVLRRKLDVDDVDCPGCGK